MSNYEQKYIKYKNKYLILKKQLDNQNGGGFPNGDYVFFIKSYYFPNYPKGMTFEDFIKYTMETGPCGCMYFKVGPTNIIYPIASQPEAVDSTISSTVEETKNQKKINPYSNDICNLAPIKSDILTNNPIKLIESLNDELLFGIRKEILNRYIIDYFDTITTVRNNNNQLEIIKVLRIRHKPKSVVETIEDITNRYR
jgi:hypothetical protein